MIVHPAFTSILAPTTPVVKLIRVENSVSDLTTYTFSNTTPPNLGTCISLSGQTYTTAHHVRSRGRKFFIVVVHAEDSITTFGVNSVTLGGVAGTEVVDRGGGGSAINTALYTWSADDLRSITTGDIVVTFSEAVTSCAVSLLEVENVGIFASVGSGSTQGTGELGVFVVPSLEAADRSLLVVLAGTCAGVEDALFTLPGSAGGGAGMEYPKFLYGSSNAEMSFAAAWAISKGYTPARGLGFYLSFSSTGSGDAVAAAFY